MGNTGDRNFYANCVDTSKLQACRPNVKKGETIIRIIPEIVDGVRLPMIKNADGPQGPDFSNFMLQTVTLNAGTSMRFSGLSASSDRENEEPPAMVFPGLYIRLRGRQKKGQIPSHLKERVADLLQGEPAPLPRSKDVALVQAIVTTYNGKKLDKAMPKQCVFLTQTAAEAIGECLTAAYKAGIDVFDPKEGREIILTPEKQRVGDMYFYNAALGNKVPISEAAAAKLWVPWADALRFFTFEQHLRAAVDCFGKEIVSYAFPDDYERIFTPAPAAPPVAPKRGSNSDSYVPDDGDGLPGDVVTAAPDNVVELELDLDNVGKLEDDGDDDQAPSKPSKGAAIIPVEDAEGLAQHYSSLLDDDE